MRQPSLKENDIGIDYQRRAGGQAGPADSGLFFGDLLGHRHLQNVGHSAGDPRFGALSRFLLATRRFDAISQGWAIFATRHWRFSSATSTRNCCRAGGPARAGRRMVSMPISANRSGWLACCAGPPPRKPIALKISGFPCHDRFGRAVHRPFRYRLGIMDAFHGIGQSGSASLAVVAPASPRRW